MSTLMSFLLMCCSGNVSEMGFRAAAEHSLYSAGVDGLLKLTDLETWASQVRGGSGEAGARQAVRLGPVACRAAVWPCDSFGRARPSVQNCGAVSRSRALLSSLLLRRSRPPAAGGAES